ncbi:hypothetical protein L3V32_24120 [Vibrio sp. J2-4]|uniref:hypothetical protein n=1 Tax=Vibrio sp. J2-4 TaxID=1507977 RepID=UPI001F417DA8|nr:hypothetical protein [Vibrio sp. J2-4]MCF7479772.1 hypothetical protein [Vibrio sp. J2-4]
MNKQLCAVLFGALLILFGLYCPFAVAPIAGNISGFNVFGYVSFIALFLSALSIYGVFNYRYTLIKLCGLALIILFSGESIRIQTIFINARELYARSGDDLLNTFTGTVLTGAGVTWGAGVLLIGSIFLFSSAWLDE